MVNWTEVLSPERGWKECYPVVADEAKRVLDAQPPNTRLTLTQLQGAIMPFGSTGDPLEYKLADRMQQALVALAHHQLADYATRNHMRWEFHPRRVKPRSPEIQALLDVLDAAEVHVLHGFNPLRDVVEKTRKLWPKQTEATTTSDH